MKMNFNPREVVGMTRRDFLATSASGIGTLALASLKIDRVFASAVPTGMGMVKTEHGMLPRDKSLHRSARPRACRFIRRRWVTTS